MKPILQRQTVGEILELPSVFTQDQVKQNYKRLIKLYHPDVNKAPEAEEYTKRLNKAFAIATGKEKPPQQPPPQPVVTYYYTYGFYGWGGSGTNDTWTTS